MVRAYSYADAVRLLGAKENKLLAGLDRVVGGALLGGSFGLSELLGWFDAKADFIRLGHELLVKAGEKRSGLSRRSRTERLQAAHAVIVVVAFFEALRDADLPVPFAELSIKTRGDQLDLLRIGSLFDGLWPLPSAANPFEDVLAQLVGAYDESADALVKHLKHLRFWDRLDERRRDWMIRTIYALPEAAARRYEELLRQAAADYPELRFWAQIQDGVAARASLARLETAMTQLLVGVSPDTRREELARRHRAVLDRPIIDPDEVPPDLVIPLMRDAYVDPHFQVMRMSPGAQPAALSWWKAVAVREDLFAYLAGYLTSPEATAAPLLVLGDPGSGKSLLTRVLAARLPACDFLTVRVELRSTPTEADLLDQIEHGLRAALQEQLSWMQLARSAGDALPVVLLDGFDELLQATGISQTRYLVKIQQFQRQSAEAGHPVVVIVTSRISVSSAVQVPLGGHVLRLTPFAPGQVTDWLKVWNATNVEYFTANQLLPLPVAVTLKYRELAQQPLLLLMLALYDAVDNTLQRDLEGLGEADLYERLLVRFARRESDKLEQDRAPGDRNEDVEKELDQLSVVAFAMFNRGTQWIGEADLNVDMASLLGVNVRARQSGTRTPLSAGEAVLGRFFFVQRAEAMRDAKVLRTYEFLHATFGEYLVARFAWRVLGDLVVAEAARPRRHAAAPLDDSELYAILSFTPLTSRKPVLGFLRQMADKNQDRPAFTALVKRLHADAEHPCDRSLADYVPVSRSLPARHAVYDLNLLLLYGVLAGRFDVTVLDITDWPRRAAFWKSQLSAGEWQTLVTSVQVTWAAGPAVELFADHAQPSETDWTALLGTKLDVHSHPLPMGAVELDFTADVAANMFRYAIDGAQQIPLRELRAIYELTRLDLVSDEGKAALLSWARELPDVLVSLLPIFQAVRIDVLARMAYLIGDSDEFWKLVFARVGRGEDDSQILDLIGAHWSHEWTQDPDLRAELLEAWLRLREQGFQPPTDSGYPHLMDILDDIALADLKDDRPDLVVRTEQALRDFGLAPEDLASSEFATPDETS